MAQQYAPRLALIAVVTVLLRGMFGSGDFGATVIAAAVAGGVFFGLGLLVGELARRLVEEHVQRTTTADGRADEVPERTLAG